MKMKQDYKQNLLEQSIYWIIWVLVFATPLLGDFFVRDDYVERIITWRVIGRSWLRIMPFFVLFMANNYVLMPYLFLRKKYYLYISISLALILFLCFYSFNFYLNMPTNVDNHKEQDVRFLKTLNRVEDLDPYNRMPLRMNKGDIGKRERSFSIYSVAMPEDGNMLHDNEHIKDIHLEGVKHPYPLEPIQLKPHHPPVMGKILDSFSWILISILLFGFNIAIKLLFQSFRDEEKMRELEKNRLKSELQYLRYQINPHFFMNTLNNIHALCDIDVEKAKSSIIKLSKLMRYVLYEANNETISLNREIQFLSNYIMLMRLRYTDKIQMSINLPKVIPEVQIPPLLFISFVENAFKHGVSYQNKSFIKLDLQINDKSKIVFECYNSNWNKAKEQHHGIGLENIRKRLNLLYGDDYMLSINENEIDNSFKIILIIPIQ